ncbi:ABC transporter permease [Cohnella massiliensis]|uniref:ABC transporter permease n=1 Tax=Cohnella massiliensis TaxID=1816691 RepID=UPI0009B9DA0A|nr:ABC transporter permease [Cohnella massiliensis]
MTITALSFTLLFVIVTMLVSAWKKLGLERDIAVGTVRAAVQLLAVGYILQFVFQAEHPLLLVLIIALMIVIASHNAAKRGKGVRGVFWRIALAIAMTEGLLMAVLLGLGIVDATAQYVGLAERLKNRQKPHNHKDFEADLSKSYAKEMFESSPKPLQME